MTAFHPLEQAASFADFVGRQRWRVGFEVGNDALDLVAHPSPVLDGEVNVGERRFDLALQLLELTGVGLTVYLIQLPGLRAGVVGPIRAQLDQAAAAIPADIQYRVNDQVDCNFGSPEDDAKRVNQEGRVVGDDHDHGMRRLEAIALRVRVEYAHQRLPGRPSLRAEGQVLQCCLGEHRGCAFREVFFTYSTEV